MSHWWCMECEAEVGLGKHGRCAICESQAVDLLLNEDELTRPDSATPLDSDPVPACSGNE
jgi:hypothetical protein